MRPHQQHPPPCRGGTHPPEPQSSCHNRIQISLEPVEHPSNLLHLAEVFHGVGDGIIILEAKQGGEYLLQVKANQKKLFKKARALDKLKDTPFLSIHNPGTGA